MLFHAHSHQLDCTMLHAATRHLVQAETANEKKYQMCRFVGIVVYQGLVEDVLTFESEIEAETWVMERRREYGTEETSDSLTWDTKQQLPIRF